MSDGVLRLTEREREILRLLVRGHDAKSSARTLGISVNSVNERLRDARQKLGVSSSREAARLLAAREGSGNDFLVDEEFGLGSSRHMSANAARPTVARGLVMAGGILMILLIGAVIGAFAGESEQARGPLVTLPVPNVTAMHPRPGSVVEPGVFQLSVTFDTPMQEQSYSLVRSSPETFPTCDGPPTLSQNRRTYIVRCMALPGRQYEIWFNRPPYMNFKSEAGVPAKPTRLRFRTSSQ